MDKRPINSAHICHIMNQNVAVNYSSAIKQPLSINNAVQSSLVHSSTGQRGIFDSNFAMETLTVRFMTITYMSRPCVQWR